MRAALLGLVLAAPAAADPVWGCDGVGFGGADADGWRQLVLMIPSDQGAIEARADLPEGKLFAGLPVCADLDGDGADDIVAVERDVLLGPQVAVYGRARGRIGASLPSGDPAATLTVVAAARIEGRGVVAAVAGDGLLTLWTLGPAILTPLGTLPGYAAAGGVRACGAPQMLVQARDGTIARIAPGPRGVEATPLSQDPADLPRLIACEDP